MTVYEDIKQCRDAVHSYQRSGRTVGLVPTMGALHEGHRTLIRASKARCGATAVTIFVNPTQFARGEDFARYPRPIETDLAVCRAEGVDFVFTPSVEAMYPPDATTTIHVRGLTERLCGPHRPGHFEGVTTIVAKLFNILPADFAFFGEKDYQQLVVIRTMVRDLNMPVTIVACPTVREPDGLAMSSRNAYLTPHERRQALSLSQALFRAVDQARSGERRAAVLIRGIIDTIESAGPCSTDYVAVVDAESLVPLERIDRAARICLAVRIGATRLIDNVAVDGSGRTG